MNLGYLIKRQGRFFLLSGCVLLFACNKSVQSEPESLADNKIYINHQSDRQYPPENVMQIIENQSEGKANQNKVVNNGIFFGNVFHQFILKNGLKVDFLLRDDLPEINIMAIINSGKDQVSAQDELLSPLVLKLLKQGTKKYTKSDFQQVVSLLGEPIRYWQTSQHSVLSINILPQDLDLALNLLAQQLAYIKPDNNAFQKIVEQQLLENKLAHSSGSYLAKLLFYQNNYPKNHVYYQYAPDSNAIKNLKNSEILGFYEKAYKPSQTRLIISGDIDTDLLQSKVTEYFSAWNTRLQNQSNDAELNPLINKAMFRTDSLSQKKYSQFDFIERKGSQQIDLLYGVVTVPGNSSDWLSLNMIATLLGGGPGSRLFSDLREKQGLTYFISARQLSGRYENPFFIQTSIAPEKLIKTVNGINQHIDYLCRNEVTEHELVWIKQQLSAEIMFKLQTNQQLVNNKLYQFENNLSNDYLYQLANEIKQINVQQLYRVTHKYLCAKHHFIAVGELGSIDKTIRKKLKDYQFRTHHLPLH